MHIDFWYEFASTYSYPAAMRVGDLAAEAGVGVHWRPFLLGPIFAEQGWLDSPFNIYPSKGAYMWRDMERICDASELDFHKPIIFPQNGLKAARIALVGYEKDWIVPFSQAVYVANFVEGKDIANLETLSSILRNIGLDPDAVVAESNSDVVKSALRAQIEEAKSQGVFGAPSFTVDGELFWGNDRLEQAIDWAANN